MQGVVGESSGFKSITYSRTGLWFDNSVGFSLSKIFGYPIDLSTIIPLCFEFDLITPGQILKNQNTELNLTIGGSSVHTWTQADVNMPSVITKTLLYPVMRNAGTKMGHNIGDGNNILVHTGMRDGTFTNLWDITATWRGSHITGVEAHLTIHYLEVFRKS